MAIRSDSGDRLMENRPGVIVAGELFIDLILSGFESWPQPGKEIFARDFQREIGGGAAITASGLARLGSPSAVLGIVGMDSGEWVAERLRREGVDTTRLRFDATEPTAITVIASTPEERSFLTYRGANRKFEAVLMQAAAANQFVGARHIHLAFAPQLDSASQLVDQLRASGCSLSLDIGWHEEWLCDKRALALLQRIDIFFPNEVEARCMTGEENPLAILEAFASAGLKRVALKLGRRGAALLWDGQRFSVGAHPVSPLDTTGAGDSFDAGFLHAWLNGEAPASCLQTANICAALSTEAYGGIAGFPTRERLASELRKGPLCAK